MLWVAQDLFGSQEAARPRVQVRQELPDPRPARDDRTRAGAFPQVSVVRGQPRQRRGLTPVEPPELGHVAQGHRRGLRAHPLDLQEHPGLGLQGLSPADPRGGGLTELRLLLAERADARPDPPAHLRVGLGLRAVGFTKPVRDHLLAAVVQGTQLPLGRIGLGRLPRTHPLGGAGDAHRVGGVVLEVDLLGLGGVADPAGLDRRGGQARVEQGPRGTASVAPGGFKRDVRVAAVLGGEGVDLLDPLSVLFLVVLEDAQVPVGGDQVEPALADVDPEGQRIHCGFPFLQKRSRLVGVGSGDCAGWAHGRGSCSRLRLDLGAGSASLRPADQAHARAPSHGEDVVTSRSLFSCASARMLVVPVLQAHASVTRESVRLRRAPSARRAAATRAAAPANPAAPATARAAPPPA